MAEISRFAGNRYHILAQTASRGHIKRYTARKIDGGEVMLLASDPPGAFHLAQVANILRLASHPSLPAVLETFEADKTAFAVLDVPNGTSLTEKWQEPSVSEQQRLTWLIELCLALNALQAAGAVATTLLPESLAVVDNRVMLVDPSVIHTEPGQIGRLAIPDHYIPPELLADPPQISGRADVYSIGTLLASLLLGRLLGDEDMRGDSLRPIREVLPTVAPEVEDILFRAMHREPDMRSASASLLAELLGSLHALLGVRLIPGAATNIGLVRLANEDRYLFRQVARQSPEGELSAVVVAVADGIGGEEGGERASRLALDYLETYLSPHLNSLLTGALLGQAPQNVFSLLQEAASSADEAIRKTAQENQELHDMGTTLAVVLLVGSHAYVGNVGDSRVYLVSKGSLYQLSQDHTVTAEMMRRGELSLEEAKISPARRRLTRALGYGMPELYVTEAEVSEGEGLLLCSDGLTETVTEEEIADTFETLQDPEIVCRQLVHLANLVGGPDNITAVAVQRIPRHLFGAHDVLLSRGIYCHQCGSRNVPGAQFCLACGAGLHTGFPIRPVKPGVICPSCNAINSPESKMCHSCGWLLPLAPGAIFVSRYRIIRMLGQGGMGRAYLVEDLKAKEQRVLKELISDANSSPEAHENYQRYFRNEAEVQSRLGALRAVPNLLEPVEEADGRLFFIMEYIPGDDLARMVRKRGRPFSPHQVRKWAIQLCDVLDYLQNYRPGMFIVHRDIAPDNIRLRGSDPETSDVVLMDFGLARLAPYGHEHTPGLGRQGYAAPEQLAGKAEPRSDLFSLAATMYYLLTGREPGVSSIPIPPAVVLNPDVPEWLSELIAVNLQENPEQRYSSAATVKGDLIRGTLS